MSPTTNETRDRPRPVMTDVARLAGVSLGTVSNVLNTPNLVAAGTRERVERAIEELGFVRNRTARSLAMGRADTVGFVIVDLANSLFLDIARGAEEAFDTKHKRLLLANSDVDLAKQTGHIELFEETQVAGILLAPLDAPLDAAQQARGRGMPVVQVNWPGSGDACGVVADEELGGYLAAKHVIALGRRRLVFAGGPFSLSAVAARRRGVLRACEESRGVEIETIETPRITVRGGHSLGVMLAERPPHERPDALVCASDALAFGAMQPLLAAGVSVPEDLAIVGFDNNRMSTDSPVRITSVGQPGLEMGRVGAELLMEEIALGDRHEHRTIVLPPSLHERASTIGGRG